MEFLIVPIVFWTIVLFFVVKKVKANKIKKTAAQEMGLRRKEAEDYILNSGDEEAIKTLMLARANPGDYKQIMTAGMKRGNSTLTRALGGMAGVVAGAMLADAIEDALDPNALEDISESISAELDSVAIDIDVETDTDVVSVVGDIDFDPFD